MSIVRAFIGSVMAALVLSAVFGIMGQPEDTFAFGFVLSLFHTIPFSVVFCTVSYMVANSLASHQYGEWRRTAVSFILGGVFCYVVAFLLAFLSPPADPPTPLIDNAKLALLFEVAWCVYFLVQEMRLNLQVT